MNIKEVLEQDSILYEALADVHTGHFGNDNLDIRTGNIFSKVLEKNNKMLVEVSFIDSVYRSDADMNSTMELARNVDYIFNAIKCAEYATSLISGNMLIEEGHVPSKKFGELLLQKRIQKYIELFKIDSVVV